MEPHDNEPSPPSPLRRGKLVKGLFRGFIALGLIALGAVGATVVWRYTGGPSSDSIAVAPSPLEALATSAVAPGAPAVSSEVFLSPEAVAQADIKTAEATVIEPRVTIQLPGNRDGRRLPGSQGCPHSWRDYHQSTRRAWGCGQARGSVGHGLQR